MIFHTPIKVIQAGQFAQAMTVISDCESGCIRERVTRIGRSERDAIELMKKFLSQGGVRRIQEVDSFTGSRCILHSKSIN